MKWYPAYKDSGIEWRGCNKMVCKETEIRNIVSDYVKELQKKLPVKRVILFGSYAHGRPTKGSDIDIAVVSDKFNKMDDIKEDNASV